MPTFAVTGEIRSKIVEKKAAGSRPTEVRVGSGKYRALKEEVAPYLVAVAGVDPDDWQAKMVYGLSLVVDRQADDDYLEVVAKT